MTVKEFMFTARTFPCEHKKYPVEINVKRDGQNIRLFRSEDIDDVKYLSSILFDAKIDKWFIANDTVVVFVRCPYEMQCGVSGHCFRHFCGFNKVETVETPNPQEPPQLVRSYPVCRPAVCPIRHPTFVTNV